VFGYQLANLNIAKMREALESPVMVGGAAV
jgi:hypothetical protein